MSSRSRNGNTKNLAKLIDNINKTVRNTSRVCLKLKIDEDDSETANLLKEIKNSSLSKISIEYIKTPRAQGYLDLHKAYNDLFFKSPTNTKMFWIIADDVVLLKGWDQVMFDSYEIGVQKLGSKFPFTLHQDDVYYGKNPTYDDITEHNESWPIFTKEWILTLGGFGLSPSTDGWTSLIEYTLMEKYGFDPRIILPRKILNRVIESKDIGGSSHWNTIRSTIKKNLNLPITKSLIHCISDNIALKSKHFHRLKSKSNYHCDSIDKIFTLYDPEFIHHKSLYEVFKREGSLRNSTKAQILSKLYARHIFPSASSGSEVFKQSYFVIKELICELLKRIAKKITPNKN